jgi:hypothetical protein
MNTTLKQSGLSARRKTLSYLFIPFLVHLFVLSVFLSACNEKRRSKNTEQTNTPTAISKDSLKPNVNIKVNKRYDDKGNVVRFDSTYTSFYSNLQGDTARMDSLMSSFDRYFKRDHRSLFSGEFNSLFFNDSMRYNDFFHDDFFLRRYESNDQYLRDMMDRMDSIKNKFYHEDLRKGKNESKK